jgi:antirestriction protein ArdC
MNASTGKPYHGVNVLALWANAVKRSFCSGYWATYRQWHELGAQVRKGERGSIIVFYKAMEQASDSPSDGDKNVASRSRLIARASWVFNADQVDGWAPTMPTKLSEIDVREHVETFIAKTRADIRHGGDMAFYHYGCDFIAVPHPDQFTSSETSTATECYYSVVLHELTHWTGAPNRLARSLRGRFGDNAYAMEEMIAEFGAAFLCADLGIANEPRLDHACYVSSWLTALNEDRAALFTAANKASVATAYLAQLTGGFSKPS